MGTTHAALCPTSRRGRHYRPARAKILKDRGIVRNLNAQVKFGNAIILKEPVNDPSGLGGGVHSEDNDDDDDDDGIDEVDALSLVQAQEAHFRNRLEAQLRRVKLLRRSFDSEDEDDLREFLEAERRMQEGFGPVEEGEDEDEARLRGDVEEGSTINRRMGHIRVTQRRMRRGVTDVCDEFTRGRGLQ